MVLGAEIGGADVGEDGVAYKRAEGRGGGAGEEGKEVLEEAGAKLAQEDGEKGDALDGGDDVLVAEDDEVVEECLAGVWCERAIVLEDEAG